MASETRTPAQIFHVSEIIADECIARGWSLWDFAERIGALDVPLTMLSWELYAAAGPTEPHLHMGEDDPMDLERVFGISAASWRRTADLCRQHPDRVAPLSQEAFDWYGLGDPARPHPEGGDRQ